MLIAVDEEWLINSDIANRRARMNDAQLISKLGTENEILKEKLEIAIKALDKMVNYNSVAEQVDKYYYIVLDVREIGEKALKEIKE